MRCEMLPTQLAGAEASYGLRSLAGQYGMGRGGEGGWGPPEGGCSTADMRHGTEPSLRQFPRVTIVRMAQTTEEKKLLWRK
jgi:hypothetical protein